MDNTQNNGISNEMMKRSAAENEPAADTSNEREEAVRWAKERVTITSSRQHTHRPWATTWQLNTTQGHIWLKQLAPVLSGSVNASVRLSQRFPDWVPGVVAADVERGLLLSNDHTGKALSRSPDEKQRNGILSRYAHIQSHSTDDEILQQALPQLRIDSLVADLTAFLNDEPHKMYLEGAKVSARHFLSKGRCRRYLRLLREYAPLLNDFIGHATALPATINHGDLRPGNAAQTESGELVLYDWDEAVIGPAGVSLHAMFSGSLTILEVLHDTSLFTHPEKLRQPRRELETYLQKLVSEGYADRHTMVDSVGASAVAGMLYYIIGFSRFSYESREYQHTVRRNIKKRMSDLIDVCDWLCLQQSGDVLAFSHSHFQTGSGWRAERLLQLHLERQPMHALAWAKLGVILRESGRLSRSIRALEKSTSLSPMNPMAQFDLGMALTQCGKYIPALKHLTQSLATRNDAAVRSYHDRVTELYHLTQEADKPGTVPTVTFTAEEKASGILSAETLELCETLFRKHGALLMKDIFDPELLTRCHNTFVERYRTYLSDTRHKDALRIGDKRFQITLDMEPPYNSPKLYGNGLVVPLMKRLVGQECILGCFVSVMSLPGSENQRLHKDHKDLFYDDPEGRTVPSFAVTVMVPLVDLDEHVGTTRIVKGSHRLSTRESKHLPMQTPIVKLGDCYLMDYRLSHHGQANHSTQPRPIVSMLYQRPWFRDYMNFRKQPPMRLARKAYDAIPESLQPLFRWTTEPR